MIARIRLIGLLTGLALVLAAFVPAGSSGVLAAPLAALTQTAEPPTLTPIPPTATPVAPTATPDLPPRPSPSPTATTPATATALPTDVPPPATENDRPRSTPTPTRTVGPIQIIPLPSAIARDEPPSPTAEAPPASGESVPPGATTVPAVPGDPGAPTQPAPPAALPSTGTVHSGSPTALLLIGLALIGLSLGLRRKS
jgi:hypothetical protein